MQKERLRQVGNICIVYLDNTQVPPYEQSMVQQEVMLIRTQGCVNWYYDWRFWYQHVNCYTSAAACCSSFIASWSAFKTNGIKYLFVAIMPVTIKTSSFGEVQIVSRGIFYQATSFCKYQERVQ
jgi:hypothetical protein